MLNLLNWRQALRQRVAAVGAAVAVAAGCCLCGLFMTFYLAPRQALQAAGIARLPAMGAAEVAAAAPGDRVLVTGTLDGNPPLLEGSALVAYEAAIWEVELLESEDGDVSEPSGRWQSQAVRSPELRLTLDGVALTVHAAEGVQFGGALREEVVPGDPSGLVDDDSGTPQPDGTLRYRGLADGDLATVLGTSSSAGGVTPTHLFAGDRTAFVADQRRAASNFLIAGLFSMVMAPVILVGGVIAALFSKRR